MFYHIFLNLNMQVLLPVHLGRISHWVLFEFDLLQFNVTVYDSAVHIGSKKDRLDALRKFGDELNEYLHAINYWENVGCETALHYPFKFRYNPYQNLPQQSGPLGDCGVWVCRNMERVAYKIHLEESRSTKDLVFAYRKRMLDTLFRALIQSPMYEDCICVLYFMRGIIIICNNYIFIYDIFIHLLSSFVDQNE